MKITTVNTSYVMNLSENQSVKMIGIENITPIGSFSLHKGLAGGDPTILKIDITPTGFHHAYLANKCAPMIGLDYVINPNMNESGEQSFCMIKCGVKISKERFIGQLAQPFFSMFTMFEDHSSYETLNILQKERNDTYDY